MPFSPLPKVPFSPAPPSELVEDLRAQAEISLEESLPSPFDITLEDMLESDAANFVESAEKLLIDVADEGGKFSDRAKAVLTRKE